MVKEPKLALSPVTIPQCGFVEAFEKTAKAGFKGIGLRYDRFDAYLRSGGSVQAVKDMMRRFDLRVAEAAFLAEWQFHGGIPLVSRRQRLGGADEDDAVLRQQLVRFLEHCEQFECENVTAAPALRETGDLDVAAEEFASLCDLARPYGVRLCLEFMGTAPQLTTLGAAADFVAKAGRPNGGVVIDTFLFHQGGSRLADVDAVPLDRVFNVQIADAKAKPTAELDMLSDRLFPGEGVAPVGDIARRLSGRGYDGWWTVELFNPDYAALDPADVAARAFRTARHILQPTTVEA